MREREPQGFTIIESLVTVVILGFVFSGLLTLFKVQTESFEEEAYQSIAQDIYLNIVSLLQDQQACQQNFGALSVPNVLPNNPSLFPTDADTNTERARRCCSNTECSTAGLSVDLNRCKRVRRFTQLTNRSGDVQYEVGNNIFYNEKGRSLDPKPYDIRIKSMQLRFQGIDFDPNAVSGTFTLKLEKRFSNQDIVMPPIHLFLVGAQNSGDWAQALGEVCDNGANSENCVTNVTGCMDPNADDNVFQRANRMCPQTVALDNDNLAPDNNIVIGYDLNGNVICEQASLILNTVPDPGP